MKINILVLFLLFSFSLNAQKIIKPNFGQKSHETLEIESIEITSTQTVFTLSITNKIKNGEFCADKNIYLKSTNGYEIYQIIKTEGIPQCPSSHKFKAIDEKLSFKLYFPKISDNILYLDLVENCENACFSFKGIILSETLNSAVNEAYKHYSNNDKKRSAQDFESLIYQTKDYPYAFLYFAALKILQELGDEKHYKELRNELFQSNKIDKNLLH